MARIDVFAISFGHCKAICDATRKEDVVVCLLRAKRFISRVRPASRFRKKGGPTVRDGGDINHYEKRTMPGWCVPPVVMGIGLTRCGVMDIHAAQFVISKDVYKKKEKGEHNPRVHFFLFLSRLIMRNE